MFEDKRFVNKLPIGALFSLGPVMIVGIFLLIGYLVEIVRRSAPALMSPR